MKLFIDLGIIAITFLMMLAVGFELNAKSLRDVVSNRARVTVLLLYHVGIPPLVGIAIVALIPLRGDIAAAILLLAACPIGDIANLYTVMARGNPALSLTLNATTCLLAPVSMLLVFAAIRLVGYEHGFFAVPAVTLFTRLALFLFLPVAMGSAMVRWWRRFVDHIRPLVHRLVGIGILLMLTVILIAQWEAAKKDGPALALTCFIFIAVSLVCGFICNRLTGISVSNSRASLLCFPTRNVGVASLIAITLLDRLDYASVAAIYFLVEVPSLMILSGLMRSRASDKR